MLRTLGASKPCHQRHDQRLRDRLPVTRSGAEYCDRPALRSTELDERLARHRYAIRSTGRRARTARLANRHQAGPCARASICLTRVRGAPSEKSVLQRPASVSTRFSRPPAAICPAMRHILTRCIYPQAHIKLPARQPALYQHLDHYNKFPEASVKDLSQVRMHSVFNKNARRLRASRHGLSALLS